ncbi:39S ribosomal protein L52, mitochondrial isoform X5 [Piliocolobus tephrosceles]|uniref:39S ribosomal protein L52, mitochondrial isoform X5 n=1 Tax=Piliocolobus tephrosceles TaxID=591936 RepID=UPI000E6B0D03|nr:39S ribosomal protein L52, mitochondrial isoform X5 [Piliocolobus tephrosceles]
MATSSFPHSVAREHRGHAYFRLLRFSMAALAAVLFSVRRLHCGAAAWAGGQWRLQQGLAANPSGYGPLTDLPDWSYADGRPAPPMKGQLRRKAEREKFAVSETSCTAVTGNGHWITSMAAQAAEVAGRTKEEGKCS